MAANQRHHQRVNVQPMVDSIRNARSRLIFGSDESSARRTSPSPTFLPTEVIPPAHHLEIDEPCLSDYNPRGPACFGTAPDDRQQIQHLATYFVGAASEPATTRSTSGGSCIEPTLDPATNRSTSAGSCRGSCTQEPLLPFSCSPGGEGPRS